MTVAHLQGKRTGRRRGSKSMPPAVRGLLWASRNLGKDVEPPTDEAKFWTRMAGDDPKKFLAAVEAMHALPQQPRTDENQFREGDRVRGIFISARYLVRGVSWPLPPDAKMVGCDFNAARDGVVFVLSSAQYAPLAKGQPVPEIQAPTTANKPSA